MFLAASARGDMYHFSVSGEGEDMDRSDCNNIYLVASNDILVKTDSLRMHVKYSVKIKRKSVNISEILSIFVRILGV